MPRSGEQTRQQILAAAVRLFGERGVTSVSLREVNTAAGQRNNNALHYHFGDRAGLLDALAAQHMPAVDARTAELLGRATDEGRLDDVRTLIDILIRPLAEYGARGPAERSWLLVVADLATHPRYVAEHGRDNASPEGIAAGFRLYQHLAPSTSESFSVHRLRAVTTAALHLAASRARLEDLDPRPSDAMPYDLFIADLVDMMAAALDAPLSDVTRTLLRQLVADAPDPAPAVPA